MKRKLFMLIVILITGSVVTATHAQIVVKDGMVTINGAVDYWDLFYALNDPSITSIHFAEGSSMIDEGRLAVFPANPNAIIYNLPEDLYVINGIIADDLRDTYCRLNEKYPFNAPVGFKASVELRREFTAFSDESTKGWQSIVSPFTVKLIMFMRGFQPLYLVPFSEWDGKSKYPFWIFKVGENGRYEAASSIEPNTVYLISIPNDPESFKEEYCINGAISFLGDDVAATSLSPQNVDAGYTLTPNFSGTVSGVYGLNAEGTRWEGGATVGSFQAYASDGGGSAPQFLPIFSEGNGIKTDVERIQIGVTGIDDASVSGRTAVVFATDNGVMVQSLQAGEAAVYTIGGQLVKVAVINAGENFIALPSGQYVINGKIVMIR